MPVSRSRQPSRTTPPIAQTMTLNDVVILIPSHSLEDFPTDLGEKPAEGLLNAFAVAWHPWVLAQTRSLPGWHRADSPPEPTANRLIIVPTTCEDRLPGDWVSRQREAGSSVVTGVTRRDEMLQQMFAAFPTSATDRTIQEATPPSQTNSAAGEEASAAATSPDQLDQELVADFLALGTTHLLVELLSRQMHYFGEIDEMRLRREAVAAAEALVGGRLDDVKLRLSACFEALHEARERYYPTDSYLIDLCLLVPKMANDSLTQVLSDTKPVCFLVTASDAEEIARDKPEIAKLLREACLRESAEIIGGEWREVPSPIMPLESVLFDIRKGQQTLRRLFRHEPTTWGRRRFGLSPLVPLLATRCGYTAALHFLLDDGIYPDSESSRMRWEGCDGTTIDAISRLPLAAESATSFLRLPQRLSETMQQDQGAGLILARWPDVKNVFFHDLVRGQKYSPVFGRFITLREFFERTDSPLRHSKYEAGEYLAPFLTRSVAAREPNPISRFAEHFARRQQFDSATWLRDVAAALRGRRLHEFANDSLEQSIEATGPDAVEDTSATTSASGGEHEDLAPSPPRGEVGSEGPSESASPPKRSPKATADAAIGELSATAQQQLADTILHGTIEKKPGMLILNPLSFTRRVPVTLPNNLPLPAITGGAKGVHQSFAAGLVPARPNIASAGDAASATRADATILVDVPGCGFVWLPVPQSGTNAEGKDADANIKTPLVEDNVLRNEFFEVHINPETGGIQRLKEYGRKPNRLSQQLAFRFSRERTVTVSDGDNNFEEKTFYSETHGRGIEVISRGPYYGEVRTAGDIVDQKMNAVLATFRQTFRLWRGRRILDIDIELDNVKMPDGDPWSNYFGVRWAWADTTAALTRSVLGTTQPIGQERFDSPYYFEIADSDTRTTIIHHGLPFHRKTGRRMLDSLLIVEGETRRRFGFSIAVERPYPLQAALDAMCPAFVVPTEVGPPRCGATGWFFHVDAPNVQLTRLTDLMDEPRADRESWELDESAGPPAGSGFAVRLQETEGRRQSVALRCFRTPLQARQRDFIGRTISKPTIDGDVVRLELNPFEISDVELRFDPPPQDVNKMTSSETSD